MRKKILITGGAGFIGSKLCIRLNQKGYDVTVLDNLSPQIHGKYPEYSYLYNSMKDKAIFILGNVCDIHDWEKSIDGCEAVIHLAAETGTGQSMYQIEKYTRSNIGGTSIMWDYLVNNIHNVKKVIVASSRAIYGEGKYICEKDGIIYPEKRYDHDLMRGKFEPKCPICGNDLTPCATDEKSDIKPKSIYALTKYSQEQMTHMMGEATGIKTTALRFQNVYGPGQSLSNPYTGILSIFSNLAKSNGAINIFEDGNESRDFVYIDDVIDSIILSLENQAADYESFNVGTGTATNVLTVANIIKDYFNSWSKLTISGNYRVGDIRHNYADIRKIKEKLSYCPKIDFTTGIRKFLQWADEQKKQDSAYDKSLDELKSRGLFK